VNERYASEAGIAGRHSRPYDDCRFRIRSGNYAKGDFIIADAKDGDMSNPIPGTGPIRDARGSFVRHRTREGDQEVAIRGFQTQHRPLHRGQAAIAARGQRACERLRQAPSTGKPVLVSQIRPGSGPPGGPHSCAGRERRRRTIARGNEGPLPATCQRPNLSL
jgi:hypothetical protein